jgi:hypothetical protein
MRKFLIVGFLLASSTTFSQILGGSAIDEGRKLLTKTNFILEGNFEGVIVYEIAVNRDGEVTSDRKLVEQSTLQTTPPHILAKKWLRTLNFTPGSNFPQHQHVIIQVNFKKST